MPGHHTGRQTADSSGLCHVSGSSGLPVFQPERAAAHPDPAAGHFLPDEPEDHGEKVRPGVSEEGDADRHGEITGFPDNGDGQGHAAEGKSHGYEHFQDKGYNVDPRLVLPSIKSITQLQEHEERERQCKP